MTREEIEARAEATLARVPRWVWDGATLPVPVEHIADSCFGLHVRDVDDPASAPGAPALRNAQSISGLLLPDRGEIWVNAAEAREWPPRRRFTIGHELGHWCLHRGDRGAIYCRSTAVAAPEARASQPPQEEEANLFAAALLMPARLVRECYENDRVFESLCEAFDVSGGAMGRRLRAVIPPSQ